MKAALYSRRTRRRFGKAESLTALAAAKKRSEDEQATKVVSPWTRLLIGTVATLVLAGTATIALVVVGTQVGFYRANMGISVVDFTPLPNPAIDLPVFTPLATEGVVWMCTLMAVVLVLLNRPAGTWVRSMWLFAGIAAFVNCFRAAWMEHDLLGGIVTGGLSIAGPYTVHLFVVWVKHLRTGRTLEQVRIDTEIRWAAWGHQLSRIALGVLDVCVHPRTFAHTVQVWRTFRGIPFNQAWFIASKPARSRVIARFRETGVKGAEEAFLSALDDDQVLDATVNTWAASMLGGRVQGQSSTNTRVDRSREHRAQPLPKREPGRSLTTEQAASVPVQSGLSKQDRVIAEYYRRVSNGEPVDGVNVSELARSLFGDDASRPTVSRVWNACQRGEYPNPNGDAQ